jgi:WD40 repeat protein
MARAVWSLLACGVVLGAAGCSKRGADDEFPKGDVTRLALRDPLSIKQIVAIPDGKGLVVCYQAGFYAGNDDPTPVHTLLGVWDAAGYAKQADLEPVVAGKPVGVDSLAVSQDGRLAAGINAALQRLVVWDLTTGKQLRTAELEPARGGDPSAPVGFVGFTPDGTKLIAWHDEQIVTYDAPADRVSYGPGSGAVSRAAAYSPATGLIADPRPNADKTGCTLHLYRAGSDGSAGSVELPRSDPEVAAAAFSGDGKTLAVAFRPKSDEPARTVLYAADGWTVRAELAKGSRGYSMVRLSSDGGLFAGCGEAGGGQTVVLMTADGQVLRQHSERAPRRPGGRGGVSDIAFSSDGKTLYVSSTGHPVVTIGTEAAKGGGGQN